LQEGHPLWEEAARFAYCCSWKAGPYLAKEMRRGAFSDWERVLLALDDDSSMMGYCTIAKTDCLPNVPFTPFIGFMFVDEAYRGNRLSEKLIARAKEYAKSLGFEKIYLCSGEIGLYEKYGFVKIGDYPDAWGNMEQLFFCDL